MHSLVERLDEVPVSGWLSPDHIRELERLDFDVDLFHQLPLAGPVEPRELVELAASLPAVVAFVHRLDVVGPISMGDLQAFERVGFEKVERVRAALAGPVSAEELLALVGQVSGSKWTVRRRSGAALNDPGAQPARAKRAVGCNAELGAQKAAMGPAP